MSDKTYRLKGHESFAPREGWFTKGLMAVSEDSRVFSKSGSSDALGVGTNMAKSIRFWLKAAGLVTETPSKGATLTDIGNTLLKNDPYLEDTFSLWIIHLNVTRNFQQATSWNVFFNKMKVSEFSRDEMISMMTDALLEATKTETLSERSIKDDCAAILAMYCNVEEMHNDPEDKKVSPFAELGLLQHKGKRIERTRPDLRTITPDVLLYCLSLYFQENPDINGIHIDELVDADNMPGKLMNLNRITINDLLDTLHNRGDIIVNRTAGLDIVYMQEKLTPADVLTMHYK